MAIPPFSPPPLPAVSRGGLLFGNTTPSWATLAVGPANSVLWSNGTDPSWSTAPQLANIADTGGTNRITTATAVPQVTVTGALNVTTGYGSVIGFAGAGGNTTLLEIRPDTGGGESVSTSHTGLIVDPFWKPTANNLTFTAIGGLAIFSGSSQTGTIALGLDFTAAGAGGTGNFSIVAGVRARPRIITTAATVTDYAYFMTNTVSILAGSAITNSYGMWVQNTGSATITNVYGVKVDSQTAGTNRYGIHVGDITAGTIADLMRLGGTTAFVEVKGSGTWTAAANQTPVWIAEGATPTARQLKTFDPGNAGANFTAGQLVCLLV